MMLGDANGATHGSLAELEQSAAQRRLEFRVLGYLLCSEYSGSTAELTADLFTSTPTREVFTAVSQWLYDAGGPMGFGVLELRLTERGMPHGEAEALARELEESSLLVTDNQLPSLMRELRVRARTRAISELGNRVGLAYAQGHFERGRLLAGELEALQRADADWRPTLVDPLSGFPLLSKIAVADLVHHRTLADELVVYAWQDIVVSGSIAVIAGSPASGKTTLMYLYACARASRGEPLELLSRPVYPARSDQRIVIIEAEHSAASAARKLFRTLHLLGLPDSVLDHKRMIVISRKAITLGSAAWKEVVQLIAAGLVSDLLIDTLARFAPADANDEGEQVAVFEAIAAAIESAPSAESQPSCIIVAHTRKGAGEDLEAVSGSTQRTGQSDTTLIVTAKRDASGRVVSSKVSFPKLREDPGEQWPTAQSFAIGGGMLRQEPASQVIEADKVESIEADARALITVVSAAQPLSSRGLRVALKAAGHRWGPDRTAAAVGRLCHGIEGMRLRNIGSEARCQWVVEPSEVRS